MTVCLKGKIVGVTGIVLEFDSEEMLRQFVVGKSVNDLEIIFETLKRGANPAELGIPRGVIKNIELREHDAAVRERMQKVVTAAELGALMRAIKPPQRGSILGRLTRAVRNRILRRPQR